MLQRDLDALIAALGPRPKRPAGVHDWAPPFSAPYCRKCGATTAERRAMQECVR